MTTRATARGAQRTSLDGERADVIVCGASFAGLAVARELARSGAAADVLVLDRYAIGERATSACAIPTPWMAAMGVQDAARQELPGMSFTTPRGGRVRYRLPWTWTAFDYPELCRLLWAQCGSARFETAVVTAAPATRSTPTAATSPRRCSSTPPAGAASSATRTSSRRRRRSAAASRSTRTTPAAPTSTSGWTAT